MERRSIEQLENVLYISVPIIYLLSTLSVKIKNEYTKQKIKLNQMMYTEVSTQLHQDFLKNLKTAKTNTHSMA